VPFPTGHLTLARPQPWEVVHVDSMDQIARAVNEWLLRVHLETGAVLVGDDYMRQSGGSDGTWFALRFDLNDWPYTLIVRLPAHAVAHPVH